MAKGVGTKLPEDLEKKLIHVFGSGYNGLLQTTESFFAQRRLAKKDLKGIFTEAELKALLDMHNGTIFEPKIAQKTTLVGEIEDSELYENTLTNWAVDKEVLVTKVNKLTELQAFWMQFECWAFWYVEQTEIKDLDKFVNEFM